ncbi:hypothetical protein GCM10027284_29180 [Cyclobacterium sediminis]
MNNLYVILIVSVIFAGCNNNYFNIEGNSPIILSGELGEIRILLKHDDILIDKLEIFNKENKFILRQEFDDNGLIFTKLNHYEKDSASNLAYTSFLSGIISEKVNDTLTKETYHNLVTTREFKVKDDILYLDMYEHDEKRYNALNMKLLDSEWVSDNKVNLLLKNYFPYEGEFEFYYLNSREKLISKKIEKNYYLVEFQKDSIEKNSIKIDVEIIPSDKDSLINSVFTQEIFLKY